VSVELLFVAKDVGVEHFKESADDDDDDADNDCGKLSCPI
jgi:hypothetical protein